MANDSDYLSKLQNFYAEHRVLPSYSAIGLLLGFRSKSSVAALVARLKLQGFLETAPGNRLKPAARFFGRPLLEYVQAGLPSPAIDAHGDTITIDEFLVERPSDTVLITVKGDSMIDAGIHAGDIVIVEKKGVANEGDIVVAIVDNEFTLKYLAREKNEFILKPANPAFPIIRPQGTLEVFGIVVGMMRKYRR